MMMPRLLILPCLVAAPVARADDAPKVLPDVVAYTISKGWSEARVKEPTVDVLADEAAYVKLFADTFAAFRSPAPAAETVDFGTKQVVAVCWGTKHSTGYAISVVSVTGTPKETTVTVRTTVPKGLADTAETYPAVVLVIPRTESVKVVVTGDRLPTGWADFTALKKGLEVEVPTTRPKNRDVEQIQGDWIMTEYGSIRYKAGQTDQFHFNIYIKQDRAIWHFDGTDPDDEMVMTFAVDPSKTPKEIDFVGLSSTITGFKKGTAYLGIYKLDGDTLTLTLSEENRTTRPTGFKHDRDQGISSYTFVRSKKSISDDSSRAWQRPK
jgi:uncharacterized protein (TIGR03067 family)